MVQQKMAAELSLVSLQKYAWSKFLSVTSDVGTQLTGDGGTAQSISDDKFGPVKPRYNLKSTKGDGMPKLICNKDDL